MRPLALALLLLAGPAGAQEDLPWLTSSPVLLSGDLTRWGGYLQDDPGTVWHWDADRGVTVGPAVTEVGTVPTVTASPLYPQGVGAASRAGRGPFSASNYLQVGTGSDVLDFAGDFSLCMALRAPAPANEVGIINNATANTGWLLKQAPAGGFRFTTPGYVNLDAPANSLSTGLNLVCIGRSGGNNAIKANLTAYTTAASSWVPATSTPVTLGAGVASTTAWAGEIYEVWASTTPASDALFTEIQRRFFGHLLAKGGPLTVTRSGSATTTLPSGVWSWPANVARYGTCGGAASVGLCVEGAATEYALNTGTHPKTGEATASLPTGSYVAWIEGAGTLTVANGTATTTGLSCTTQTSVATCTFTVTVAGTMLVTTTAGTTLVQVTSGTARSTRIDAAGTSASRAADVPTVTAPAGTTWKIVTVNGTATGSSETPGATITLPAGTTTKVLACKRAGGCR